MNTDPDDQAPGPDQDLDGESNLPIKEKNYNNESFYKMYRRNSGKMTGEFSIEKCLGDFVFYLAQCHKTFITRLSSKLECFSVAALAA